MGARVVAVAPDRVVLRAPLRPNWNHQRTAFGGSIATLALLAGWSLIHARLEDENAPHNLVVRNQETAYLHPITGPLVAEATLTGESDWMRFTKTLRRRHKAAIAIGTELKQGTVTAAKFQATFVAFSREKQTT